ncbi:GNAT family N-acetyltransferase [Streptomyces sp. NPDC051940]|uniref:GNAT family N-acetyltransferase n=1 Tax=Streptomyces sp. NPDC051940 TaxID=3155675 RepID=UPI003447116C
MAENGGLASAELHAEGLLLRPWTDADYEPALRGMSDPDFQRWNLAGGPEPTEEGARQFLKTRALGWERGDTFSFAVVDRATGAVLGNVGIGKISHVHRSGIISYWLLPEARGRGAATLGLGAVTQWGFTTLALHRLELGHHVDNAPSCAVAQRCAYAAEGVLRGYLMGRDGFATDVHLHARLSSDRVG